MNWQSEVDELLNEGKYEEMARFYEEAIASSPEVISHYWYLGLAYLLQEKEEEAQTTWFCVFAEGSETEIKQWSDELVEILDREALRQEALENYQQSWLIRAHLREIAPELINNLLDLIKLEIKLGKFNPEKLNEWQVIELLQESPQGAVDSEKLLQILANILQFAAKKTVEFVEASLRHIQNLEDYLQILLSTASTMGYEYKLYTYAIDLILVYLKVKPYNLNLLKDLFWFYALADQNSEALKIAYQFEDESNTLTLKIFANYQILYVLMKTGAWLEIKTFTKRHRDLLREITQKPPQFIEPLIKDFFLIVSQPLPYIEDNLSENCWLKNQLSQFFEKQIRATAPFKLTANFSKHEGKPLRIGYIAHTLQQHSVGWLSRWLFHYHNREEFNITIYLVDHKENEFTKTWFAQKVNLVRNFKRKTYDAAAQIQEDKIDILVDLDSLTHGITPQIMALKPAPIQVTWLGWDASGIPAIDYFIADPFVLPDNAQQYYQEKIWRLPQTYVAVDGFEIGVPSIRRDELNIPPDAVVYLNIQNALKRHPDTIRLQMKIIKAVSNSYFLIKGDGDQELIKKMFTQLAEEEGVSPEKLRFLPRTNSEEIHRANISIADVVLDTYPYNGATTTLEVLWMGVPLVTRVGEQFSARNSYAFMRNVGLTEGIAYSDEEYVEWGIKLGLNAALREEISWKLNLSRQTSSLWNAKDFTKEMEKAYQQMWANYCSKG